MKGILALALGSTVSLVALGTALARSDEVATGIGHGGVPPGQAHKATGGAARAKDVAPGQAKKGGGGGDGDGDGT